MAASARRSARASSASPTPSSWTPHPPRATTSPATTSPLRLTWSCVCPPGELAGPVVYISGYVGDIPVVVLRNERGLAAFVDDSRDRRHEVMRGRGNANVMQSGYQDGVDDL